MNLRLLTISCLFLLTAATGNVYGQNDNRRFIEVSGSAETTILPDVMTLEIVLVESSEFMSGIHKTISLDSAEQQLYAILRQNHIDKKAIQIDAINSNHWWYWYHSYYDQKAKTIHVTLSNKTNFMKLAQDLHVQWVRSARIVQSSNSEILKLRKEVKIQAMKAAKEKADYLLESVGAKTGMILSVIEVPETPASNWNPYYSMNASNVASNSIVHAKGTSEAGIENSQEIKLRYEVKVKFEIH